MGIQYRGECKKCRKTGPLDSQYGSCPDCSVSLWGPPINDISEHLRHELRMDDENLLDDMKTPLDYAWRIYAVIGVILLAALLGLAIVLGPR